VFLYPTEMKGKKFFLLVLLITILSLSMVQMMTHKEVPAAIRVAEKVPSPLPVNPYLQAVIGDFEKEFISLMELSHTPGASLAIVKDSTILFIRGFGVKRTGTQDSIDVNTVFRLGSVSKPFASFLTGILVQDSVLSWRDHVTDYLPSFALKSPEQTSALSLENVLSHTTGLPYHTYTNLVEEGQDLKTLLERLRDVNLSSAVGKEYSYQNVAYSVIAEVMKSATGKSYETLMAEKVFFPLGMKNASADYASLMANPNVAYPHLMRRGGFSLAPIKNTYYNVAPAGGINASIDDMAHWMMALLNTRPDVINKETLTRLYTPVIEAPSKNRRYRQVEPIKKSYYGLGWRVLHYAADTLLYHGGYVNGYRSEIAVHPKENIAICVLANAPGGLADNSIPLFFHLYRTRRDSVHRWENDQKLKRTLAVP
jgi:beta-lactamase class C